jgi:hypothetical protein
MVRVHSVHRERLLCGDLGLPDRDRRDQFPNVDG